MSLTFSLALQSLRNRKLPTVLTLLSIALSAALLVGVENVRQSARESFKGVISQTDLIVGARTGSLQLLLYSVFNIGSATANVSYGAYQRYAEHPAVEWAIPISLGDSHRGYRVVGTTGAFFEHYRFRNDQSLAMAEGRFSEGVFDVTLGSEVAEKFGYTIGKKIVLSHGMSARGIMDHDDKPFTVVGILERTATPVDRGVYVTLQGIEAIHVGWEQGAPPMPGEERSAEEVQRMELQPAQLTAAMLGLKSRIDTIRLQREINTDEGEALMAIIPGVVLNELWRTLGYAEDALFVISVFVALVGLSGMLTSLYTTLNERRREMAILRALGAGPGRIVALFVLESTLLSAAGALLGLGLFYGALLIARPIVEQSFGLYLVLQAPGTLEWIYLGAIMLAGFWIGFVPALRAYRNALADGLAVRI